VQLLIKYIYKNLEVKNAVNLGSDKSSDIALIAAILYGPQIEMSASWRYCEYEDNTGCHSARRSLRLSHKTLGFHNDKVFSQLSDVFVPRSE
jgi:hypothetical protein